MLYRFGFVIIVLKMIQDISYTCILPLRNEFRFFHFFGKISTFLENFSGKISANFSGKVSNPSDTHRDSEAQLENSTPRALFTSH